MRRLAYIWLLVLVAAQASRAQTTQSATPLLQQISRETQALYDQARSGLVRVQMPPPRWAVRLLDQQNPIHKWHQQLDPAVRQKLAEELHQYQIDTSIEPATQPQGQSRRGQRVQQPDGTFEIIDGAERQSPDLSALGPRMVGLILDDQGHVLVPFFIEREAAGDAPLRAWTGAGEAECTFVGSDRPTNLTVLRLREPQGTPVQLRGGKPAEGALVMLIGISGEAGRLTVWSSGQQGNAIVLGVDGSVAGLTRFGQFLAGEQCRMIVEQIIEHGMVQRAHLGVIVQQLELPNGRPVVRIDRVKADSEAQRVGLQPGDLIVAVAGEEVWDLPTFAAAIALRRGPTELRIQRGTETLTITADLQPKP